MAQFIPLVAQGLSTIGGGSAAAGAAVVASTAATGLSIYSQHKAGQASAAEAEQARQAEKIKASEDALGRRERLIRALAAQNARVGASGVDPGSGSPVQVALQDIDDFEREDMAKSTLDQMRQRNFKAAAKNASRSGKSSAGISLLKGAGDLYTVYGK